MIPQFVDVMSYLWSEPFAFHRQMFNGEPSHGLGAFLVNSRNLRAV